MNTGSEPYVLDVTDLNQQCAGVARLDGRVVFIDGALPKEKVLALKRKRKKKIDQYTVKEILEPSCDRVVPECPHFAECGGCSLQHFQVRAQLEHFQARLRDQLMRIGGIHCDYWERPLVGDVWSYRHKARLGVRFVEKKGGALVGFRERLSNKILEMNQCLILTKPLERLIAPVTQVIRQLSISRQIPQLEIAAGDHSTGMVLRHLKPLSAQDYLLLGEFAHTMKTNLYLQSKGMDSIVALPEAELKEMKYQVGPFSYRFKPWHFIQNNLSVNRLIIDTIGKWFKRDSSKKVLELFCGLGNFSLPLAHRSEQLIGFESDSQLIAQARENAHENGVENAFFEACDLYSRQGIESVSQASISCDQLLLDPPRSGASDILEHCRFLPPEILYISCNPATLVRDLHILTKQRGYRLQKMAVAGMFPHTHHTEALAYLEKS